MQISKVGKRGAAESSGEEKISKYVSILDSRQEVGLRIYQQPSIALQLSEQARPERRIIA